MNDKAHQRIGKTTAVCMLTVATLFDSAQVASKILTLLGLTLAGGVIGAITCAYMNIDFPKSCTFAGGAIAFAASFTGIGTAVALKVGILMSWLADVLIGLLGRLVLYFWFQLHGVSVLSGTKTQKKMATTMVTSLVGVIPFLATLPDLTVWTAVMVYHARSEDKEKEKAAEVGYNDKNWSRVKKRPHRYAIRKNY